MSNTYILSSTGELYHYGIKGMKWGVRRYQDKNGRLTNAGKKRYSNDEIREERSRLRKEGYGYDDADKRKVKELYEQAERLARKYDFDADDGGGGTTADDRRAGKRYMELTEEAFILEEQMDYKASVRRAQALVDKYGEKRMKEFETHERRVAGAKALAFAIAGIGLIAVAGMTD